MTGAPRHRRIHLSVVIPVHNEAGSLPHLIGELDAVLRPATSGVEVIVVDDGSTDETAQLVSELAGVLSWIRLVRLRTNRGQTAATAAGIDSARGTRIALLDGDGQNDPAEIPRMLDHLERHDVDVVAGRRRGRHASRAKRSVSAVANALLRGLTGAPVHDAGCSLKVFRGATLRDLPVRTGDHRFLAVWAHVDGARVAEVDIDDRPRRAGTSHYGMRRVPAVLVDLLGLWIAARFRDRPLRAAGWGATVLVTPWLALALGLLGTGSLVGATVAALAGASVAFSVLLIGALAETSGRRRDREDRRAAAPRGAPHLVRGPVSEGPA